MKTLISLFVLLGHIVAAHGQVQLSEKYPGYSEHTFHSMAYGLFKPTAYDPKKSYPFIVYLHGSNDLVSRDLMWYGENIQKRYPSFVLSPKCKESNQGWGNTWHAGHPDATAKTLALVDSLVKQYNIDINRLYLYGISMGGFGAFSILSKEPGKFAAAYIVCGGSSPEAARSLLHTPLWIFHGAEDDIVPAHLSSDVYREIIKLGGSKAKYTEYPGVKHNSWENVAQEQSLPSWLFSQRMLVATQR